ncbi:SAP30-binding isoform X1, partial [Brachionus plicatilis]
MSKSRKPKVSLVTAYESGAESDSQTESDSEQSNSSKSSRSSSYSRSTSRTKSRSKSPTEADGLDSGKKRQREFSQEAEQMPGESVSMDYEESSDEFRKKSEKDNVESVTPQSSAKVEAEAKEKTDIEQDPNFFTEKNGFLPGSEKIKLPPAPETQCSQSLQNKIIQVLDRMKQYNYSINNDIKNKKKFKNPSIYEKLIEAYALDEFGSSFDSHIVDLKAHGYMFYDELDQAQMAEWAKKDKERKDRTK